MSPGAAVVTPRTAAAKNAECTPLPIRIVPLSEDVPRLPIRILLLVVVRFSPAFAPIAMLLSPLTPNSAFAPTAVFSPPVTLSESALTPSAVLRTPLVFTKSAAEPTAVLEVPPVF